MRSLQVFIVTLCLLSGSYLLLNAPDFFLVDRFDAARGHHFSPQAAQLLGAGLLCIALAGLGYLRQFYSNQRYRPSPGWQKLHFALLVAAMLLIGSAYQSASPGPNPDFRPPAQQAR